MSFDYNSLSRLNYNAERAGEPAIDLDAVLRACEPDDHQIKRIKESLATGYDLAIVRRVGSGAVVGYQVFDYDEYEIDVFMGESWFAADIAPEEQEIIEQEFRRVAVDTHF